MTAYTAKDGHEHRRIGRHHRKQNEAREGDGAENRQERKFMVLRSCVAGHELGGLAHERAAKAVGVKRQRLVAQAVEGHGGKS